jgi:hypothetical protein
VLRIKQPVLDIRRLQTTGNLHILNVYPFPELNARDHAAPENP